MPERKKKILFICTHNAARSQMAEGLLRTLQGNRYEVFSAGIKPGGVSPHAVAVMAEIGIDIRRHRSKSVADLAGISFDEVVTVCDHAGEVCPVYPGGGERRHRSFEDPSALTGKEEEILSGFRRIRDEIKVWIGEQF